MHAWQIITFVTALAAAAPGLAQIQQKYPSKPVRIVVGFSPGNIHYGLPGLGPAMSFIKDGRLLPLAVANPKRSPLLPDVPAMVEILPGFERDAAHALLVPARTPRAIVNQISKDVAPVLELPDVKERMQAMAFEPAPTTPEEYDRIIRNQMEIFTKVAKAAGLIAK